MLHRIVRTCLLLVLPMIAATAQALNENATIVLHARDGFAPCDDPQQHAVCVDGPPTLDLTGMQMPWVYVMIRNYDELAGLDCAFDWPLDWIYLGGTWDCQQHMITVHQPSAPGPVTGQLLTAFDCVRGGALATIGRMIFGPATTGCLSVIDPIHALVIADCSPQLSTIPPENRGRVCAGPGGYDACLPASTPVESTTWGAIKGQYR